MLDGQVMGEGGKGGGVAWTSNRSTSYESEEDAGLFDGAAVAEEADDEDEGSSSDEQIGRLSHHQRLQ